MISAGDVTCCFYFQNSWSGLSWLQTWLCGCRLCFWLLWVALLELPSGSCRTKMTFLPGSHVASTHLQQVVTALQPCGNGAASSLCEPKWSDLLVDYSLPLSIHWQRGESSCACHVKLWQVAIHFDKLANIGLLCKVFKSCFQDVVAITLQDLCVDVKQRDYLPSSL